MAMISIEQYKICTLKDLFNNTSFIYNHANKAIIITDIYINTPEGTPIQVELPGRIGDFKVGFKLSRNTTDRIIISYDYNFILADKPLTSQSDYYRLNTIEKLSEQFTVTFLNDDLLISSKINPKKFDPDDHVRLLIPSKAGDKKIIIDAHSLFKDRDDIKEVVIDDFVPSAFDDARPYEMFKNCINLTVVDIRKLDIKSTTDMTGMFENCTNLEKIRFPEPIISFEVNATNMFKGCTSLKKLDLSFLDKVTKVNTTNMFSNTSPKLKQIISLNSDIQDEYYGYEMGY